MGVLAYSNRDFRYAVHLRQRDHHTILRAYRRICNSASMETARAEAPLQTLGLPDCADPVHYRSFVDCVGLGGRKTPGLIDWSFYCWLGYPRLPYLAESVKK